MQRIGVFVCHCGTNIAGTVDVKAVAEALKTEPGVVFSTDYQYMCSQAGQEIIKNAIAEYKLTGIVVCSCSPRMHEATFRKTAAAAGLNPYMVEIANIREQCSWVHKEMPIGTEKAIILAKAAVAKVNLNAPLTPGESPVTKRALVIGGGIAGIQTALDIADAGFPVDIVETKPTIGGKMAQLDKTFPTLDCAACILTPKMVDVAQNDKKESQNAGESSEQSSEEVQETAAQPQSEAEKILAQGYYIVQSGDSLESISTKIYGNKSRVERIKELNQIENADTIFAGQKLNLP